MMRKLNIINTLLLCVFFLSCGSTENTNPYSGMEYEEICEEFDALAFEQKAILEQIRTRYAYDKQFIARFNQEQMSWISYQDTRLRSLYSKDWDRHYRKEYGVPTFNGCKCKELIRLSKIRNNELKVYLDGPSAEQQECPIQGNKKGA